MSSLAKISANFCRLLEHRSRKYHKLLLQHEARCSLRTSSSTYGATKLLMPAYSPTMTEGTIVKWHKNEGDKVSPGDVLCELKTDKAVVSFEADEDAILAKIILPDGTENVMVGTLIAMMVEEGDDWRGVEIPSDTTPTTPITSSADVPDGLPNPQLSGDIFKLRIGPSVRKLLEEYSVSPGAVTPTGPLGNLLKSDVLEHITTKQLSRVDLLSLLTTSQPQSLPTSDVPKPASKASSPATKVGSSAYTDTPLTGMRSTIAKRLTQSKSTIPHAYALIKCRMNEVEKLRRKLINHGVKVSVNDFIVKAAAMSLEHVPTVNMVWQGEKCVMSRDVDISVAVATEGGLITPIVSRANRLGLEDISKHIKDLASRAREGKLKPHEYQGGTFTISNLGMYGITHFSAVINPPQCAILAVGSTKTTMESGRPGSTLQVQLSHDARVIDETVAANFLDTFRELMETPSLLMAGLQR